MAKRKSATTNTNNTFDSGFFSDEIEPPEPKRRAKLHVPKSSKLHVAKASTRVPNQPVEVVTNQHRLATPAQGGEWRKTCSPLADSTYEMSRSEQLHSPSLRLGTRSDHDVSARLNAADDAPAVQHGPCIVQRRSSAQDLTSLDRKFLADYKRARVGSEDGVPSQEDIVALLRKHPGVNDQSLVTTLLQDIVDLKADLEHARESNGTLRHANQIMLEMEGEM